MTRRAAQPRPKRPVATMPLLRGIVTIVLVTAGCVLAFAIVAVCLLYRPVRPLLRIELGDPTPHASAFLREGTDASYEEPPEGMYPPGNYVLKLRRGKTVQPVLLIVWDTIPPAAESVERTVSTKQAPTPDKFVKNITDQSVVKLTYDVAPKFGTVGDYTAIIRLEDESGGVTRVPVKVHVRITRESVECEAGDPAPDASAFLIDTYAVSGMTEITDAMMHTPGTYPIALTADGTEAESLLIVRDTKAPEGRGISIVADPNRTLTPEDFVADVQDETAVSMQFLEAPDPAVREPQTVRIRLCDLGRNCTDVEASVLFTDVAPFEIEADAAPLSIEACLEEGSYETASFVEPFVPDTPGSYAVPVYIDGTENLAIIEVKDTTAPSLIVFRSNWYLNAPKEPAFFAEAADVTATELRYETEPDWKKKSQTVTVVATDAGGNEAKKTFTLKLEADAEPPVLYGVQDRYSYINEPVAYLTGVSASDNCDETVTIKVNASKVNSKKLGTYPVTYTAKDRAGNTAKMTVQFTFVAAKVTEERAEEVAQKILDKVLYDGMTLDDQVEALYEYVFRNVRYVARSNKQDWRSEAVRALTNGKGDCFSAYAALRLLLEHTDAQIMSVQRYATTAHHYWLLVNVGSGWYHVDACRSSLGKKRCFMWTNEQKNKVSKTYWRYNEALYPPVATEPYRKGTE